MSRTKGHSRSAITGSGGRGMGCEIRTREGLPAPACWLASAGRRSPVAWWRPLPEWRERVLPGQAPQRREQDVTEDGAEDDPLRAGRPGSAVRGSRPGRRRRSARRARRRRRPRRAGRSWPRSRRAARTPVSSSRAGVSGLARQPRPRMSSPPWGAPACRDASPAGCPYPGVVAYCALPSASCRLVPGDPRAASRSPMAAMDSPPTSARARISRSCRRCDLSYCAWSGLVSSPGRGSPSRRQYLIVGTGTPLWRQRGDAHRSSRSLRT